MPKRIEIDHSAGRDGKPMALALANASENPKAPPQWSWFNASHPIEAMRLRGSLGEDELETLRRYQAAGVFERDYLDAMGLTGARYELRERVDTSGHADGSIRQVMASSRRVGAFTAKGMTQRRFFLLDDVVGKGMRPAEVARRHRVTHATVTAQLKTALDVLADYYDPRIMERVSMIALKEA